MPLEVTREFVTDAMWVSNCCLRFTSLCPVTGQPDWAELYLNYIPAKLLVESKSLKEYLNSFRMHGGFHEDVCRVVCDDLACLLAPRYLKVLGHFDSRGSICIWPYVQYARPGTISPRACSRPAPGLRPRPLCPRRGRAPGLRRRPARRRGRRGRRGHRMSRTSLWIC